MKVVRNLDRTVPSSAPLMPIFFTRTSDIVKFKIASRMLAIFVFSNRPLALIVMEIALNAIL